MPYNQLSKVNYVHVGRNGTFFPDSNELYNSLPEDIDALFEHLKSNNKKKLLLYFHGGIVPTKDGLVIAERIVKYTDKLSDAHPFCFIWETGLSKTITDNLNTIWSSGFFQNILFKVLKISSPQLDIVSDDFIGMAKGSTRLSDEQIATELCKENPFGSYHVTDGINSVLSAKMSGTDEKGLSSLARELILAEVEEEVAADQNLNDVLKEEMSQEEAFLINPDYLAQRDNQKKSFGTNPIVILGITKIVTNVITRFLKKRNHDFFPTVVEETLRELYLANPGQWVWGNMKKKASDMWKHNTFEGNFHNWPVGAYFIKKLSDFQNDTGRRLCIDLVGHSAGSIVICELLKEIASSGADTKFRNILFMAPACRCELFERTVISNQHLFEKFRSFTMKDELEKVDSIASIVYPMSLLYFISGVLENESDATILGMQRHIIGAEPYTTPVLSRLVDFLKEDSRVIFSKTDIGVPEGFGSLATSHGGFDDQDELTLESIMYLSKL